VHLIKHKSRFFQLKPMNHEKGSLRFRHACESRNPSAPGDARFRGHDEKMKFSDNLFSGMTKM
jgi:hypothetical protein